jgi:hypothetical protein
MPPVPFFAPLMAPSTVSLQHLHTMSSRHSADVRHVTYGKAEELPVPRKRSSSLGMKMGAAREGEMSGMVMG